MIETASTETKAFHTEDMTLNVGPQHPSTHGVLRFVVKTDGEVIREAIPDVGYLHRSIEKIGEKVTWHRFQYDIEKVAQMIYDIEQLDNQLGDRLKVGR